MSVEIDRFLDHVLATLDDKKANEVSVLNLRGISLIADYFVITHGNSDRQVQAIVTGIKGIAHEHQIPIKRVEGFDAARWVLVDLGDIVVHVFHRDERAYYNLERLWSDALRVERV